MPSFETMLKSQKIMWIKRLLTDTKSRWKTIALSLMGVEIMDIKCKLSVEYLKYIKTPFYLQVLENWFGIYSVKPVKTKIQDEILWNNKFILIGQQPANKQYKYWINAGIVRVRDIIHDNGEFLTAEQLQYKYNII